MTAGHVLPLPTPVKCASCGADALPGETCPASVYCDHCHAEPFDRCRLPNGHATSLHRERWQLAAGIDRRAAHGS